MALRMRTTEAQRREIRARFRQYVIALPAGALISGSGGSMTRWEESNYPNFDEDADHGPSVLALIEAKELFFDGWLRPTSPRIVTRGDSDNDTDDWTRTEKGKQISGEKLAPWD
jgi:hypothetical protein